MMQSKKFLIQASLEREVKSDLRLLNDSTISTNGRFLAVISGIDFSIALIDLSTGHAAHLRSENQGSNEFTRAIAAAVSFCKGDRYVVGSSSPFGQLTVWDTETATIHKRIEARDGVSVRLAPLGSEPFILSLGIQGAAARLWNIDSGELNRSFYAGDSYISTVATTLDGKGLITGHQDGSVFLWSMNEAAATPFAHGHTERINSLAIAPATNLAVSGSTDATARLWDLSSCRPVGTIRGAEGQVRISDIAEDGEHLALLHGDSTVRIWDKTGNCLATIPFSKYDRPISAHFPAGQSTRLVVASTLGLVRVYRLTRQSDPDPLSSLVRQADINRRYVSAKVVLVGESGVGKSGLAHRLAEDRFQPTDSTHGLEVKRIEVPNISDAETIREIRLWDFAGQEDYRLIHQLYLDDAALALMLFDPQVPEPFGILETWLRVLEASIPSNGKHPIPKLLIATRSDVGTSHVSQKEIDRFMRENNILAYLPTSAKTGENCSDRIATDGVSPLKQLIAQHIQWDELPWTSTPKLAAELKSAVTAVAESRHDRLLRFEELQDRLQSRIEGHRFSEEELRASVALLASQGELMPLDFGDLLLLHAHLINGYAAAVIRAARTHPEEIGSVLEADVLERRIDFTGIDRLEPKDEQLLMHALVQLLLQKSLCIAEHTAQGRQLIFPSQFRRDVQGPNLPALSGSFTFTGEWKSIFASLAVRLWYSQRYRKKELWRNTAMFETSDGHRLGLQIAPKSNGSATLAVFFDGDIDEEQKLSFVGFTQQHLEKHGRHVIRDRIYSCPRCTTLVTAVETVRRRVRAGKTDIACQECDFRIPLVDPMVQELASESVSRLVSRMDLTATHNLVSRAKEQILIGDVMTICGRANQIFRPVTTDDEGIDGEIEFRVGEEASGQRIYVQLKSGHSHLRERDDGSLVFPIKKDRHITYWQRQPVDVWLVVRLRTNDIRWMNITKALREREDETSKTVVFDAEAFTVNSLLRLRDRVLASEHA